MKTTPRPHRPAHRARPALLVALASAALAILKASAGWLTGSSALLASAADSAADAVISTGNGLAIRAAGQPADHLHPFGHGKLEHLVGFVQGVLIAGGGVFVVIQAAGRLGTEKELAHRWVGLSVAVFSLVAAYLFTVFLLRASNVHDSPALKADSLHYGTDVITHAGVVVVFLLDLWIPIPLTDPIVAVLIAFLILRSAWQLLWESSQRLLDARLEPEEVLRVEEAITGFGPPVRGYHDLLTRRSGPDRFVQVHVEIEAQVTFRDAHRVVDQVAAAIRDRLPRAHVIIHADPWPENPDDVHEPHAPSSAAG
jgi:ferrous-iron efflux pump FieF